MKIDRSSLRIGIGLVALSIALWLIFANMPLSEITQKLSRFRAMELALLVALTITPRILQGESLRNTLLAFDKKVSVLDSFVLTCSKALYNQVMFGAGTVSAAQRLRQIHQVPVSVFAAALLPQFLSQIFALALFGLMVAAIAIMTYTRLIPFLSAAWIALLFVPIIAIAFPISAIKRPAVVSKMTLKLDSILQVFRSRPGLLLKLAILQLGTISIRATRIWVILKILSPQFDTLLLLQVFSLAELTLAIPLTPNGTGLRELFLGVGATNVGAVEILLLAGVIDRVLTVALTVTLGLAAVAFQHGTDLRKS